MKKKTITVNIETWRELTRLKADWESDSLDSVIKTLLKKAGELIGNDKALC